MPVAVDSRWGSLPATTPYSSFGAAPELPASVRAPAYPIDPRMGTTQSLSTFANQTLAENQAGVARNEDRNRTILGGYGQRLANSRMVADQNQAMVDQFGNSQRQFIEDQNTRNLAAASTSANRRGLGNTTIRDSLERGVNADFYRANLGLEDQLLGNRLNVSNQNIGRENEMTDQRLQYLANIEDQYPTLIDAQNYGLQGAVSRQSDRDRATAGKAAKRQRAEDNRQAFIARMATIQEQAPLMGDTDFSNFAFHNSGIGAWRG